MTDGTAGGTVRWPADEAEATAEQERIRGAADLTSPGPAPGQARRIAGVDVTYDEESDLLVAAAVVLDAGTLRVLEEAVHTDRSRFPYVPGLLAFRELPPVLAALGKLSAPPDLVVCDGYGYAHPRRAGLAVHLGVLTGLPCFGVAKSPFAFDHTEPGPRRGDASPLLDRLLTPPETVGRALRTQPGVKPVFVSAGHGIGLDHACAHTLRLAPRYRLPETTRGADGLGRRVLREIKQGLREPYGAAGDAASAGDAGER
ncbi:endonuclease V [Streptomyces sp. DH37]|uniref:endonuclease V n=1 Tax=Streptomyces sp. DH37 TaxID=3040122 RepID=UPI002442ECAF|nr:endonuclease V [Streptomyces sp. DH37]MDG9705094.1 endonuclease V [Streptomyces sp. DH37]